MRVWLITVGEPLPMETTRSRKWRTGYLAETLRDRGHDVLWWTSTVNHFTKTLHQDHSGLVDVDDKLKLYFLHGRPYKKNISFDRLVNHRQVAKAFAAAAPKQERPDVILCSLPTLELSEAAVAFGKEHGIPVTLDIRDPWPDTYLTALPSAAVPFARKVILPLLNKPARRTLARAESIIGTSQGFLDWALALAGRDRRANDRLIPLGYPEDSEDKAPAPTRPLADLGIDPTAKLAWFIGSFTTSYNFDTMATAAEILAAEGHDDIRLIISGAGNHEAAWRARARSLDNVVFTGWLGPDDISAVAKTVHVGLACYGAGAVPTLPNKIFEYLSYGLPIISSLPGEVKVLLAETRTGLSYAAGDARGLADCLIEMFRDEKARRAMSVNGRATFEARFETKALYAGFAEFLEQLGAR